MQGVLLLFPFLFAASQAKKYSSAATAKCSTDKPCPSQYAFKKSLTWNEFGQLTTLISVGTASGCNHEGCCGRERKFPVVLNSDVREAFINPLDYDASHSSTSIPFNKPNCDLQANLFAFNWDGSSCALAIQDRSEDAIEFGCNVPTFFTTPLFTYNAQNSSCSLQSLLGFAPRASCVETWPESLFGVTTPRKKIVGLRLKPENLMYAGWAAGDLIYGDLIQGYSNYVYFPVDPITSSGGNLWSIENSQINVKLSSSNYAASYAGQIAVISTAIPFVVFPMTYFDGLKTVFKRQPVRLGSDGLYVFLFSDSEMPDIKTSLEFGPAVTISNEFGNSFIRLPADCSKAMGWDSEVYAFMIAGVEDSHSLYGGKFVFGTKFISQFYTAFDYESNARSIVFGF